MKCQAQLGRASKRSLLATGRLSGTRSRGSLLELRSQRLGSASRQHCFSWETCPGRSATTSGHPSTSRSDVRRRLRSGPRRPQQTTFGQCNRCKGLARATTTLIEYKSIDALRGPLLRVDRFALLPQKIKWTSLDELEHLLYGAGNILGGTRVSG